VTFSLLIAMGWLAVPIAGYRLSLAAAFVAGTLAYYFLLDAVLALCAALWVLPLAFAAARVSALPMAASLKVFLGALAAGAALQLVGHAIEGKRPALVDNFTQAVFTAPLFLMAEILTFLGIRKY